MDVSRLSQGERIVLVAGVLLMIDLLFLPWHSIDLGGVAEAAGVDTTHSGVQAPNGFYGIVALILTLVMVVQIVLDKLTAVALPDPPVPWSQIHLIAGIFVLVVLVIKLIRDTSGLGYGAYSGILGGLLVAYGAYLIAQDPGEAT